MKGDILFLAHRLPFPPDRGDRIRSYHLLKALCKLAPVHVGCLSDGHADPANVAVVADMARSLRVARRRKSLAIAGIEALATGKPASLTAFGNRDLKRWVERTCADNGVATIVVFSGQMGQYVPAGFEGRVVVDLCDVDSAKFDAYAGQGRGPRTWIDAREGRLLACEEARLAKRADATLLISEAERDLFLSRIGPAYHRTIHVVRNGIDAAFFDPAATRPHAALSDVGGPRFVFTGQMDYPPNIAAAIRFIDRLFPAFQRLYPEAEFHCVGRAPPRALRDRSADKGVRIWGEVPDMRPFLAGATIVVAPLEIARGIQNKVLEAMAMARPVLLSSEAATGIEAKDGHDFAIGASDDALVERGLALLADPQSAIRMGRSAREYVRSQQSWDRMLEPLGTLSKPGDEHGVAQVVSDAA